MNKQVLRDGFLEFKCRVMPKEAGPIQVTECERVWFAAASYALRVMSLASVENELKGFEVMDSLAEEIQRFANGFRIDDDVSNDVSDFIDKSQPNFSGETDITGRPFCRQLPPGRSVFWVQVVISADTTWKTPVPDTVLGSWLNSKPDDKNNNFDMFFMIAGKDAVSVQDYVDQVLFDGEQSVSFVSIEKMQEINLSPRFPATPAIMRRIDRWIRQSDTLN